MAEPGGVDIPLPPEWEASDPNSARATIVGRGGLSASAEESSTGAPASKLNQVGEPTPVTTSLFTVVDGQVEVSGTLDGLQYRYTDPTSWLRSVVWHFEANDRTYTASVGYPEFPDSNAPPTIQSSLTGLDPLDLLADVRFFE